MRKLVQVQTVEALCLKAVSYAEHARIATYFTREHGRLEAIVNHARGANSKLAGACEAGHLLHVHVHIPQHGTGLAKVQQYEMKEAFQPPQSLYVETAESLFSTLGLLAGLQHTFQEADGQRERVFDWYSAVLACWNAGLSLNHSLFATLWFWQGILQASGLIADWHRDVYRPTPLAFPFTERQLHYYPERGGFSMVAPEGSTEAWPVSKGTYNALRVLEHAQHEGLHRALNHAETLPLETLHHAERFYMALRESLSIRRIY
jgi:recombinational DNA repair protein (RecF pathway)